MKNIKRKITKAEKALLFLNIIVVIIFILSLIAPQAFTKSYFSVKLAGLNVPVIFILNFIFLPFWLYRIRLYFLIPLFTTIIFLFILVRDQGFNNVLQRAINVIKVDDSSVSGLSKDYIGKNVSLPVHPRLLLPKDDEITLQKAILSNPHWNKLHHVIIETCDEFLKKNVSIKVVKGQISIVNPRECLRRLFFLSYAWRTTSQKKYLDAAKNDLINVASVEDWRPSNFTNTAEITFAAAIGYDWLYNDLQELDRILIQKAIISKGLQPSTDSYYNGYRDETSERNQLCNTAMIYGSLATFDYDPKLATQVINQSIESLSSGMALYAPEGLHPAGYQYGAYGTSFNALAIDALTKLLGNDFDLSKKPGFLKSGLFFQGLIGSTHLMYNYSDGNNQSELFQISPALFWLAKRTNNPSLLWSVPDILQKSSDKEFASNNLLPLLVIWGAKSSASEVQKPMDLMWVAKERSPVALFRTSWSDKDAIYVGFKTGSPSAEDGQMDIGSFIIDADGERWVTDLGGENSLKILSKGINVSDMTQNSRRWEIFRNNTKSHSNITVNNDYQTVDSSATIASYSKNKDFMFATADLSGVYSPSLLQAKRGLAIVGQKIVQVRDEIETAAGDNNIRWKIVTSSKVKMLSGNLAELTQGGKKMYLRVLEPAAVKLQLWSANPSYSYEIANPGYGILGFEIKNSSSQKIPITVLFSDDLNKLNAVKNVQPLKDWK
jgi:hypothetical protein